ncbi:MAG: cytochrome c [Solirubrobacterales bacterium]|nr:cytochrome c [Solirubrobacterales bacterium]
MNALLFVLVWVVAALAVLIVAMYITRDKDAKPSYKGSMDGGAKIAIALGAIFLVVGLPAVVLSKTSNRVPSDVGTYTLNSTKTEREGAVIFRQTCASCHSLSAANARGVYGPDLDVALGTPGADPKATAARVEGAIKTGGVTGKQMPAGLLSGEDSKLVSAYVAAVAGK